MRGTETLIEIEFGYSSSMSWSWAYVLREKTPLSLCRPPANSSAQGLPFLGGRPGWIHAHAQALRLTRFGEKQKRPPLPEPEKAFFTLLLAGGGVVCPHRK